MFASQKTYFKNELLELLQFFFYDVNPLQIIVSYKDLPKHFAQLFIKVLN